MNILSEIVKKHKDLLEFIRNEIEDIMLDAINMKFFIIIVLINIARNEEVVKFFVCNGLKLNTKKLKNCILALVSVSKYIPLDPPIEVL